MNYWIFKCNPLIFDIDERLKNPEQGTTWQVKQFKKDIKKGDRAFIWRCGKNLGIIGLMDVVSNPQNMHELEHELKYYEKPDLERKLRVEGKFIYKFDCIKKKDLEIIHGLNSLPVFYGVQRGTNFEVNEFDGKKLEGIILTQPNLEIFT